VQRIGRYDIIEQVGRGSMGVVYRAQDTVLEREVALKLLWEDFCDDDSALARFQREARAVARLTHRNIVTLYELAQQEDGRPYIAMEFLRGAPLDKRLRSEPPLTLIEKVDIVAQLCTGLHFAHEQGVVHRDVKPANIWVLPDNNIKLLDFGIARLASSSITRDGNVLGTASYMAPEQIEGAAVDGRADIFAAGVVLYELVAGYRPFEADSPTGVIARIIRGDRTPLDSEREHLPPALVAAIDRALARQPEERYPTAAELASVLTTIRTALERQSAPGFDATLLVPSPTVPAAGSTQTDLSLPPRPTLSGARADFTLQGAPQGTLVAAPSGEVSTPTVTTAAPSPSHAPAAGKGLLVALAAAALVAAGAFGVWRFLPARSADPTANSPSPGQPTAGPASDKPGAPGASEVRIESEPAGASVSVDGRVLPGETPLTLALEAGKARPRELRLAKRGFEDLRVELSDAQLAAGRVSVALTAAAARVRVVASGSYPFEVIDGGRTISAAADEHAVSVTEGRQLRLRSGAVFLDQRITARGGADGSMRVSVPGLGSISVRSVVEDCAMTIDGVRTDPPPVHQKAIVSGDHVVELTCADAAPRRQRIQVREGANTPVLFRQ
jgi:serine/threonine-protein kinase